MTRLGVQLTPWQTAGEMVAVGAALKDSVDIIWVQDQLQARNVYVILAALAAAGCGVGTNVTYQSGRNPVEMASAAATVAELLHPGRELAIGIGTGGALVKSLFSNTLGVERVVETMTLMRSLWAGGPVALDEYPVLGDTLHYRPGAVFELTVPVARQPDILVAGVGPKILAAAGEHADGLICPSNLPPTSLASFRSGRFRELSGLEVAAGHRPAGARPLRLVYGINVSVSKDRDAARTHARRQLALVLGNPRLWPALEAVGLDASCGADVRKAFDEGLGVAGAAERISASLADALIVAGDPDECVQGMVELRDLAAAHGYTEFFVGAPLGPDPAEAAELLANVVIPAVWPERAAARR
jgi:alkanesulfonate monooxygenase SsuD/methylene tetrahydromethanopterin reductase-like flavin-dependent oxidoreductase (luciferase family)